MKQYIIKDILNNMYYWEFRGEAGFDLDIEEATKYASKYAVKTALNDVKITSKFKRILEVKKIYVIW